MLNSYKINNSFRQSFNFNAVSGTLIKSNPKSKMVRFHMNSSFARNFFDEDKPSYVSEGKYIDIVVLQVMLCGNEEFLAEFITKEEYENQIGGN